MLRLSNLTLSRGNKRLLDNATLTLHPGHKVGLIGANGSGKSSLIAHVAQETFPAATPAIDYVLDGDKELRDVEHQLAAAESDAHVEPHASGERLAELHHRFEAIDGYSARARAATLLSGLGFDVARHGDSVVSFSG